ncbi:LOW QUALITY PROTEIN: hypothetical protein PHMEG_00021777, partial [Phytophthora megakarya]
MITAAPNSKKSIDKIAAKSAAEYKAEAKKVNAKPTASKKPETEKGKSMKWTVQLSALAIEDRFQNKQIVQKFATKNSNTKAQRDMWEDAVNVFQERVSVERAWGDEEPQHVTIKQLKKELDALGAGYKLKRSRLLATENSTTSNSGSSDEADEGRRKYPEKPVNFFINIADDMSDSSADENDTRRQLTCNPMDVHPTYRNELGIELTALWSLLCDPFSRRPGCTGEAITESGNADRIILPTRDTDGGDQNDQSDTGESPSPARQKVKASVKSKKQSQKCGVGFPVK